MREEKRKYISVANELFDFFSRKYMWVHEGLLFFKMEICKSIFKFILDEDILTKSGIIMTNISK